MSIQNINFKPEKAGTVNVKIDNEYKTLDIKEIDKFNTNFIIHELEDTALYNDIPLKASLYDDNSRIEQGVIFVSVYDSDDNIVFGPQEVLIDNTIETIIPNSFRTGIYRVELHYLGNKYYNETFWSKDIRISKRQAVAAFDSFEYYVNAGSTTTINATIRDLETSKPVNNCAIRYKFNQEINELITDGNGTAGFMLQIPEQEEGHCENTKLKIYELAVAMENESYILKTTSVQIIIIKQPTTIDIQGKGMTIQGNVLTNGGYANYGTVKINMLDGQYTSTAKVGQYGFFSHDINITTLAEKLKSNNYKDKYYVSKKHDTNITLESNAKTTSSSTTPYVIVGDSLMVTAYIEDENGNAVPHGTIDFRLYNDKRQIYRYITEVDSGGNGTFIFYPSKAETYKIKAYYNAIVGYNSSETNQDTIIEVQNGS